MHASVPPPPTPIAGGWQLVYNRMNLFFTPDHMKQVCPSQGAVARLDEDSTSWCIPNTARRWKWDIAKEDTDFPAASTFRTISTNIPEEATATTDPNNLVVNKALKWYRNDFQDGWSGLPTGSQRKPSNYQRGFLNRGQGNTHGCVAGRTTFFGITEASQGSRANSVDPLGIGGSCDTACNMGGTNYTHPDPKIRYLHGTWTNLQGVDAGGFSSACVPNDDVRYKFNYRFWAIE